MSYPYINMTSNLLTSKAHWYNKDTHTKENAPENLASKFYFMFYQTVHLCFLTSSSHLSPILQSTAWVLSLKGKCNHGSAPKTLAWRPIAYRWDTELKMFWQFTRSCRLYRSPFYISMEAQCFTKCCFFFEKSHFYHYVSEKCLFMLFLVGSTSSPSAFTDLFTN